MPLRLYISHASEDQARVNQLRDELKAKEIQVFLCEDLPAGSDWQKAMDRELKYTDVFVYCLSSASVARSGHYHDELKAARARYRTEGEQAILIVPLRLEPCPIPAEVKDLMAMDLFPADGLKRFLELLWSRKNAASRHVFLLHGIKTRGKWQKDVSPLLSAHGLIPVPLDFGQFGARQLIWPPARRRKRQWLLDEYTRECDRLQCQLPSIVAHSFGCYLVASFLKKYSQARFDRIIFCGSIVHPGYPWANLVARGQVKSVLNQYGGEDFWAWVVQWGVEDAGPSGSSGFAKPAGVVQQQNHSEFEHSDYFCDLNYKQNWIPFLLGNPLPAVATSSDEWRPPVNWRFRFILTIGLLLCLAAVLSAGWYFRSWRNRGATSVSQVPQAQSQPSVNHNTTTRDHGPAMIGGQGGVTSQEIRRDSSGLIAELAQEMFKLEGSSPHMFRSLGGEVVVGVGHELPKAEDAQKLGFIRRDTQRAATGEEIQQDWIACMNVTPGPPARAFAPVTRLYLPDREVVGLLAEDIRRQSIEMVSVFSDFDTYPNPAKKALLLLAFDLSVTGLRHSSELVAAARSKDWSRCADLVREQGRSSYRTELEKKFFLQAVQDQDFLNRIK